MLRFLQLRDRGDLTPNPSRGWWEAGTYNSHQCYCVSESTLLVLWDHVKLGPDFSAEVFRCSTKAYSSVSSIKESLPQEEGGALMLARAALIREAVHTFPIAALSPGEEFRNDGET